MPEQSPRRILMTGITSIHGWPIYTQLKAHYPSLYGIRPPKMKIPGGPGTESLCVTDYQGLKKIRETFRPTHVVHCAGVCDLDVCEERPAWAEGINRRGAEVIRELFGQECYLLYLSTDLVFSGNTPPAGGYTEEHIPDPVSVAGKTFTLAEKEIRQAPRHCVIRLGLPLGDSVTGTKGAFDWVESRFKKNKVVSLFYDELRSCITCEEIGEVVHRVLHRELTGLYHLGGEKSWSLYQIGQYVLNRGSYPPHLLKTLSRKEEENGPPRIGDVSLNSRKLRTRLGETLSGGQGNWTQNG